MIRLKLRQLAATTILAAAAVLAPSLAGEAASTLPPKSYVIPSRGVSDAIRKAVESPDRPESMRARDGYRRPAEILALTGMRPGQRVVELGSYPYYYSTLISSVLGDKGTLHMYEMPVLAEQLGDVGTKFSAARPNTKYEVVDFNNIQLPRNVDIVVNFLNFNMLMLTNVEIERLHTTIFKALRPGGIYLVVEHAAIHGVGTDHVGTLRRIDPGTIRPYVTSSGFKLDEESRLLENPRDDHKSPAISEDESDQADRIVLKFVKPVI